LEIDGEMRLVRWLDNEGAAKPELFDSIRLHDLFAQVAAG
jgi:hypothetical protein